MIESIPYVIERELLSGRSVELPFIGVLSTQRHSARFCDHSSSMMPPYDVLVLETNVEATGDILFDSVLDCFSSLSGDGVCYTIDDIVAFYNSWFAAAQSSGGALLTIDGVCTIGLMDSPVLFSVDRHFEELLSPFSGEAFVIGRPLGVVEGVDLNRNSSGVNPTSVVVDPKRVVERVVDPERVVESLMPVGVHRLSGDPSGRRSGDSFTPLRRVVKPVKRVPALAIMLSVVLFCAALLYIAYSFSGLLY